MGILDTIFEGIASVFNAILDPIIQALSNLIGTVLYYITYGLMFIVGLLNELFNVFSGTTKVLYRNKYTYLSDVFFQNESVNNVYWALALLGIVLVFMFAVIAVVRKTFDLAGKQDNQSIGSILGAMFKSIFIMLILSAALTAALDVTNLVINRIGYAFDHSDSFSHQQEIHFTDEQIATMGRIYTTIGNYGINPSYDSRYNLNKCFNEIREDMNHLARQGVFDFVYVTEVNGKKVETWQSALQELFYATNTSQNAPMDRYNEEVSKKLLHIIDLLKSNASFYPLSDYKNVYAASESVGLDRILFLSGTIGAANNPDYNRDPYLLDGLRGAFYSGEKSIYSIDEVSEAFKIGVGGISYIFIWILAYFTIRNLLRCIFGCISRIFTMVSLYIMAPFAVAPLPLDNGEKFKQWIMSMVIQALGILGLIIPMRLIILFAPIIMSSDLVLFDSVVLNFVGKVMLIVGGLEGMSNLSGIITGILANNSGMAALQAGNSASAMGDKVFGVGKALTAKAAKGAAGVAGSVLGGVADVTGLSTVGSKIGEGISAAKAAVSGGFQNMRDNYGIVGALMNKGKGGAGGLAGLERFAAGKPGQLGGKMKPGGKTPGTPKVPQTPTTPTKPQVPGTPTTPKVPQTPTTPTKPQVPGTPTTPTVPETPGTPKTTKTETPGVTDPKKEDSGKFGTMSTPFGDLDLNSGTMSTAFGDFDLNSIDFGGFGLYDENEDKTGEEKGGNNPKPGDSIMEQLKEIADPFDKNPNKQTNMNQTNVENKNDKNKDKDKDKDNKNLNDMKKTDLQNQKIPPIRREGPKKS